MMTSCFIVNQFCVVMAQLIKQDHSCHVRWTKLRAKLAWSLSQLGDGRLLVEQPRIVAQAISGTPRFSQMRQFDTSSTIGRALRLGYTPRHRGYIEYLQFKHDCSRYAVAGTTLTGKEYAGTYGAFHVKNSVFTFTADQAVTDWAFNQPLHPI